MSRRISDNGWKKTICPRNHLLKHWCYPMKRLSGKWGRRNYKLYALDWDAFHGHDCGFKDHKPQIPRVFSHSETLKVHCNVKLLLINSSIICHRIKAKSAAPLGVCQTFLNKFFCQSLFTWSLGSIHDWDLSKAWASTLWASTLVTLTLSCKENR